jgi:UDP-glucose 4-epimerase
MIFAESGISVSGGLGFVGVNLVKLLGEHNSNLRVLDNLSRSSPTGRDSGSSVKIYRCDVLDRTCLSSGLLDADKVVHLAAYGSVIESISDPAANFSVNVQGTLNVLQASVEAGVRKFIFASTGGALIGDAIPPVNELSLPRPISPYGASKLCGEAYCHAFAKSYDINTVCLRFGNVYGPHSAHKKGAVTVFIKALMTDEPIVIYGDGSASRDYIHVDDLCSGIALALDADISGGEVFHLASGRETSILQLAKMLREIAGKPNHPIEFRPARQGEVARNFASYEKAARVLGFRPSVDLREGLKSTWDWFVRNQEVVLSTGTSDS